MARLETKEDRGGNGSEAAAPRVALDGDLVNSYLQLQVRWLSLQLEAARQEAAASRDEAALAVTTVRLWQQATPTALIVLLVGGVVAVLAALTWNDLWRGLSTGQPDNLMFVTSQSTNLSGGARAVGDFMKEWKDVLLGIAGGGVLLGFKRLAYRSVRSAVVIALALVLSISLLAALVITDIHLVQNELTPMHVTWRAWSLLGLAVVVGVVLLNEVCDIAHSSPASFKARSQLSGGLGRWVAYVTTSTGLGRLLAWLATPHGWLRWLLSVGVVTAISIVLCIPPVIAGVATGSDFWMIAFAVTLPLGPIWWLLLLAVVATSPTARQPSTSRLPFTIFATTPALALAVFVAILLSPGVYDPYGSLNVGLALVAILMMEIWAFWFLWAGIALSTPLRIVFLPVVLTCAATIPMYYGLLPFLGLVAILSVGVPWSLWRSRPALAAA